MLDDTRPELVGGALESKGDVWPLYRPDKNYVEITYRDSPGFFSGDRFLTLAGIL